MRVSSSEIWLSKLKTRARFASTARRLCSMESTPFCKDSTGALLCFAKSRVICQVLAKRPKSTNSCSRLSACWVSSRASPERLRPKSCHVSLVRYNMSREGPVARSFISSPNLGLISPFTCMSRVTMASVLDWSLERLASISSRVAMVDCISETMFDRGTGVGSGLCFGDEAGGCAGGLSAVAQLKAKSTRMPGNQRPPHPRSLDPARKTRAQ